MSPLDAVRTIAADLVRKRLWPIAALLLIALFAVPTLLAPPPSPDDGAGPPPVAAAAPQPAPAGAAADPARRPAKERSGRVGDPFFDPPEPPASPAGGAPAQTAAAPSASPPGESTAEGPAGGAPARTGDPVAQAPASPTAGRFYRTLVRMARSEDATTHRMSRLTPVGGSADPAALYLGVMKVGTPYAVFLLGRHATSRGDATCNLATGCRIIGLRAGDTQMIVAHTPDGRVLRRVTVHVASVRSVRAGSAKAAAMRAKVHPDGRRVLRRMWRREPTAAALRLVTYRQAEGLLRSVAAVRALAKRAE